MYAVIHDILLPKSYFYIFSIDCIIIENFARRDIFKVLTEIDFSSPVTKYSTVTFKALAILTAASAVGIVFLELR